MADLGMLQSLLGGIGKQTYQPRDYAGAAQDVLGLKKAQAFGPAASTISREFASGNPNKGTVLGAVASYDPTGAAELSGLYTAPRAGLNGAMTEGQKEAFRRKTEAGEAAAEIERVSQILTDDDLAGKPHDKAVMDEFFAAHKKYTGAMGSRYTGGYQSRVDWKYLNQQSQENNANDMALSLAHQESTLMAGLRNGEENPEAYNQYLADLSKYNNLSSKPWSSNLKDRLAESYASAEQVRAQTASDLAVGKAEQEVVDTGITRFDKSNDLIRKAEQAKKLFDANAAAAASGSPSAQQFLVKTLSQVVEPGLAVLQGEADAMAGQADVANQLKNLANSVGLLSDKARMGMLTAKDIEGMKATAANSITAIKGLRAPLARAVNAQVQAGLERMGKPDAAFDILKYSASNYSGPAKGGLNPNEPPQ